MKWSGDTWNISRYFRIHSHKVSVQAYRSVPQNSMITIKGLVWPTNEIMFEIDEFLRKFIPAKLPKPISLNIYNYIELCIADVPLVSGHVFENMKVMIAIFDDKENIYIHVYV